MTNIRLNVIQPENTLNIPGAASLDTLSILSTLDANATPSPALSIAGGLSLAKRAFIGDDILFTTPRASTLLALNTTSGSDNKGLSLSSSGALTSTRGAYIELFGNQAPTTPGLLRFVSGSAANIQFQPGGTLYMSMLSNGNTFFYNTATSTSSTTGSIVVSGGISLSGTSDASSATNGGTLTSAGGAAFAKSLYIGGSLNAAGGVSVSLGINTTSTVESTSSTTGSIVTGGGIGIGGNAWIAKTANVSQNLNVTGILSILSSSPSSIASNGGISLAGVMSVAGASTINGVLTVNNVTNVTSGLDATQATATGALAVTGGVYVGKTLALNGPLITYGNVSLTGSGAFTSSIAMNITNTSGATNSATGSLVVAGGMGLGGNAFVGGSLSVVGASTFTGILTNVNTTDATGLGAASTVLQGGLSVALKTIIGDTLTCRSGAMVSGQLVAGNTTEATASGQGGMLVSGGITISKRAWFVSSVNVGAVMSTSGISNTGTITSTGGLVITDSTESNGIGTGSFRTSGGGSFGTSLYVGANLSVASAATFGASTSFTGIASFTNTSESNGIGSGSVLIYGGASILRNVNVGGTLSTVGISSSSSVTISSAVAATSTTTGALTVVGGMATQGNLFAGGAISVTGASTLAGMLAVYGTSTFANLTQSTNATTGALICTGGVGIGMNLNVGGNVTVSGTSIFTGGTVINGILSLGYSNDSTSTTSGALIVAGGLGVGKTIYATALNLSDVAIISGQIVSANQTQSDTIGTGSIITPGGIGVSKNVNIGGGLSVNGATSLNGALLNTAGSIALNTVALNDVTGILNVRSGTTPGIRVARTDATKGSVSTVGIDLFSLGNTFSDVNFEALQIVTTGTDTYSILSRNVGTGVVRKLVLQSGGANVGQITLNPDGGVMMPIAKLVGDVNAVYGAGSLNVLGDLAFGTAGKVLFTAASVGPPTFTTRSAGTRLVLLPALSGSSADMAIGVDSVAMWFSVKTDSIYRWYSGITVIASLDATGVLNLNSGAVYGSAGAPTTVKVLNGSTSGGVQIAPVSSGGAALVGFFRDNTMTALSTDTAGDAWYIGKNLFASGNQNFGIGYSGGATGNVTVASWDNAGKLTLPTTIASSGVGTGAVIVRGGMSVSMDSYFGGSITVAGNINGAVASSAGVFSSTAQSTSTATGAVIVGGGMGVGGNMFLGGSLNVSGASTLSGAVSISSTLDASSPTNGGALTIGGGLGLSGMIRAAKDIYVGGRALIGSTNATANMLAFAGILGDTSSTDFGVTVNAALVVRQWGGTDGTELLLFKGKDTGVEPDAIRAVTGEFRIDILSATGSYNWNTNTVPPATRVLTCNLQQTLISTTVSITSTVDSSAKGSGALTITGGLGVGGTVYSNALRVVGNAPSTSATSGTVVVTGGLGVSGDIFAGTSINVTSGNVNLTSGDVIVNTPASGGGFQLNAVLRPLITRKYDLFTSGAYNGLGRWGVFLETGELILGMPQLAGSKTTFARFNADSTRVNTITFDSSGVVSILTSTDATSATVGGSFNVYGGTGIRGKTFLGSTLGVTGVATFGDTTVATASAGGVIVSGGLSIQKNLWVTTTSTLSGVVSITNASVSTSTATGALLVSGGVGVAGDLFAGSISTPNLLVTSTTASNGVSSGALTLSGGLGVAGTTNLTDLRVTSSVQSSGTGTGAIVCNGGVGIAGNMNVGGTITATGPITSTSDARLKRNITDHRFDNVLDKIARLRTVTYESGESDRQHLGFVAQETLEVFPEIVYENEAGFLSIDYAKLSIILLQAISEIAGKMK